ncbi:MAG: DUF1919 domain-containing protein [Mobilitalea sp.]
MKNILIWGNASYYEKYVNLIMFEQHKGNINILAYISKDKRHQREQDGKPVILPEDIKNYDYDYIVVANSFFKEILKISIGLGISEDVIIPVKVFSIPMFDFNKYIEIKERKISIIAESCYGGFIYHCLGLKFNSPFINIGIGSSDYIKLLSDLDHYLSMPLEMKNDNILTAYNGNDWSSVSDSAGEPIGKLDDVNLHLIHYESFEHSKELWDKRLARFNKNDIFVFMVIENDSVAEAFDNLPFKNKLGFYFKDTPYKSIININAWNDSKIRFNNYYLFRTYIHKIVTSENRENQYFNFLDLLAGKVTIRKTYDF